MFANIDKTIKVLAKIIWWIGTITIIGIITIWPVAFILYGFGDLIEREKIIAKSVQINQNTRLSNGCNMNYNTVQNSDYGDLPKI